MVSPLKGGRGRQAAKSREKRREAARTVKVCCRLGVSTHLGSPANITAQFHLATRVPMDNSTGHLPQLTAFVMTATQGVKYFLVGDSVGWISVFTRNGTLHERLRVSNQTVSSINAHLGNVVYVAGHQWGLIDLEKGTARAFHCYKYHGAGVLDAVSDTALQTRVIAADLDGSIWVFSVRDKRDCKVEHRFPLGATRAPLSLASVRGFVLVMEPLRSFTGKAEVTVLNMTHVGKSWDDPARDVSPISWKRSSRPLRLRLMALICSNDPPCPTASWAQVSSLKEVPMAPKTLEPLPGQEAKVEKLASETRKVDALQRHPDELAATRKVLPPLADSKLRILMKEFRKLDKDGSGEVSKTELAVALRDVFPGVNIDELMMAPW
eukprot:symbB.v1.2.029532.t1/scaffold3233.1/size60571/8